MNTNAQTTTTTEKKMLIIYYSWGGNTRHLAQEIQKATGADLVEITPDKAYPNDYQAVVDQAKKEINAGYKPTLKTKVNHIEQYDVIFIGSPNWWSTIAPPVATFLSDYDLSDKTIVPFMTHGGGRWGHSIADLKKLCPSSTFLEGYAVNGSRVKENSQEVTKWLRNIGLVK